MVVRVVEHVRCPPRDAGRPELGPMMPWDVCVLPGRAVGARGGGHVVAVTLHENRNQGERVRQGSVCRVGVVRGGRVVVRVVVSAEACDHMNMMCVSC